jgi:hypothetical protein
MKLLQSVAVENQHIFLVYHKKEITAGVETHSLTILNLQSLVLPEFIV